MPRPEPWILAVAAALSAVLAVLVLFQIASALREWRMRKSVLGSLRDDERPGPDAMSHGTVLRAPSNAEGGLMGLLGERIPYLWDLHIAGARRRRWARWAPCSTSWVATRRP